MRHVGKQLSAVKVLAACTENETLSTVRFGTLPLAATAADLKTERCFVSKFDECHSLRLRQVIRKMRLSLQKIELHNFKTYRGNVKVGPLKEFTAVVGPNGSGR